MYLKQMAPKTNPISTTMKCKSPKRIAFAWDPCRYRQYYSSWSRWSKWFPCTWSWNIYGRWTNCRGERHTSYNESWVRSKTCDTITCQFVDKGNIDVLLWIVFLRKSVSIPSRCKWKFKVLSSKLRTIFWINGNSKDFVVCWMYFIHWQLLKWLKLLHQPYLAVLLS